MDMNRKQKIKQLQDLQIALEGCTQPIKDHPDPTSINDCWNWMRELLAEIKDEDDKLYMRAMQLSLEDQKRSLETALKNQRKVKNYIVTFALERSLRNVKAKIKRRNKATRETL